MSKIEWIRVKEAIVLSDTSEKTVRRRIKEGRYRSKRVRGKFGTELRIRKDDVLKDVQRSYTPGQQVITQNKSEGKEYTPGQAEQGNLSQNAPRMEDGDAPLRVLIVDESEKAFRFLSTFLRRRRLEIIEARDGKAALEKMESEQPDLAIVEIAIPEIDGLQLAMMNSDRKAENIPIIFYSWLLREYDLVQDAKGYPNVLGCFKKPLAGKQLEEFREIIKEMMR